MNKFGWKCRKQFSSCFLLVCHFFSSLSHSSKFRVTHSSFRSLSSSSQLLHVCLNHAGMEKKRERKTPGQPGSSFIHCGFFPNSLSPASSTALTIRPFDIVWLCWTSSPCPRWWPSPSGGTRPSWSPWPSTLRLVPRVDASATKSASWRRSSWRRWRGWAGDQSPGTSTPETEETRRRWKTRGGGNGNPLWNHLKEKKRKSELFRKGIFYSLRSRSQIFREEGAGEKCGCDLSSRSPAKVGY